MVRSISNSPTNPALDQTKAPIQVLFKCLPIRLRRAQRYLKNCGERKKHFNTSRKKTSCSSRSSDITSKKVCWLYQAPAAQHLELWIIAPTRLRPNTAVRYFRHKIKLVFNLFQPTKIFHCKPLTANGSFLVLYLLVFFYFSEQLWKFFQPLLHSCSTDLLLEVINQLVNSEVRAFWAATQLSSATWSWWPHIDSANTLLKLVFMVSLVWFSLYCFEDCKGQKVYT